MHKVLSGKEGAWPARVGGPPAPSKGHVLVLLLEGRAEPRGAATAAAAAGFQRVAYLAGGVSAFSQDARTQVSPNLPPVRAQIYLL